MRLIPAPVPVPEPSPVPPGGGCLVAMLATVAMLVAPLMIVLG